MQLKPQHSAPVVQAEPVALQVGGCVHFLVAVSQVPEQHSAFMLQVAACGRQAWPHLLVTASQMPEQQSPPAVQLCPKFRQDIMIVEQVLVVGSQVPEQQSLWLTHVALSIKHIGVARSTPSGGGSTVIPSPQPPQRRQRSTVLKQIIRSSRRVFSGVLVIGATAQQDRGQPG